MNAQQDHSAANFAQLAPILDEAINQLGAQDRAAILLRFFEQLDLRAVGEALGTSENAAQKRLTRALERLRTSLMRRGVTLSAAGLATALAGEAVTAAPIGMAIGISSAALASAAASGGTTFTLVKLMTMTKLKAGIVSALVVLRNEVGQLHTQQKEHDRFRATAGGQSAPTAKAASEAVNSQTIPRESWAFAGYATPENALQSVAWAMSQGDVKSFLAGLSPETQNNYAQLFQGKTENEILTMLSDEIGQLPALRLDRRKVSGDDAVTFVLYSEERDDGTTKTKDEAVMTFKNVGGEWKLDERHQSATDAPPQDAVR